MNDEIREILDKLKETVDYPKLNYSSYDKSYNETIDNVAMIKSFACKQLLDYITNLQKENEDYKSRVEKAIKDIVFCFMSIKQEADMSKDKRTRHEMRTCLAIFNETLKSLKKGSDDNG